MSSEIATLERVKGAVVALRQGGSKVTASKVMDLIGGGSKSTIIAHMRTLRNGAGDEQEVPAAVIEMARSALSDIYEAGRRAEADKLRAWSERMSLVVDEQDAEIQEFADECSRLEQATDNLSDQLQQLAAENAALHARSEKLEAENSELGRQLAEERGRATDELQKALSRVEVLVARTPQHGTSKFKRDLRTISLRRPPKA
ncbi:DNA-binding protein [Devosia sp. RR2S18]|uniref:DNA-binding protein n=1 Tax=Devosia rhizosphaerae TaxID=3049774 RepID=UPI0025422543|nr:DNA-binding protein [Devosia sp. RR2S18]WIJ25056.1 DNA-binding protein [Devosia sp. RR2S18]